jgi:hypothetical protein
MKKTVLVSALIILISNQSFSQCSTTISGTLTSCGAGCNGTVIFTSSSGTPPYNLVVTGGPTTQYNSSYIWTSVCPGSYHYDVTGASASCHDTGTVIVTAMPTISPPSLTIEAYDLNGSPLSNNPTICQLQSIDFNVQLPFENVELKTFEWKKNGITQLTQTAVNPSPPGIGWNTSTLANGDVISLTVTFTAPPPCYSPDSVTSQNITFTVTPNQPPVIIITDNLLNDTNCFGNPVTFTANPFEAGTPTYEWYLDGTPVGTASTYTTPATLPNGGHQVYCIMTSGDYCDSQDPVFNPVVTSLANGFYVQQCQFAFVPDEKFVKAPVIVFPNPATNELRIESRVLGTELKIALVEIYNVLGEKIYSRQPETSNQEHVTVNVSKLRSGIYFVKVKGERKEGVAKFVKQ